MIGTREGLDRGPLSLSAEPKMLRSRPRMTTAQLERTVQGEDRATEPEEEAARFIDHLIALSELLAPRAQPESAARASSAERAGGTSASTRIPPSR